MFNGDLTAVFSNIIGDCGLPPEVCLLDRYVHSY